MYSPQSKFHDNIRSQKYHKTNSALIQNPPKNPGKTVFNVICHLLSPPKKMAILLFIRIIEFDIYKTKTMKKNGLKKTLILFLFISLLNVNIGLTQSNNWGNDISSSARNITTTITFSLDVNLNSFAYSEVKLDFDYLHEVDFIPSVKT